MLSAIYHSVEQIKIYHLSLADEDANETYLRQILDTTEYERSVRSQTELEDSSSDGQSYKCPFCPMIEKGYTLLKNHVAIAHFEDDISIDKMLILWKIFLNNWQLGKSYCSRPSNFQAHPIG